MHLYPVNSHYPVVVQYLPTPYISYNMTRINIWGKRIKYDICMINSLA